MANEKRLIDANALSNTIPGISKDMKRPGAVELTCLLMIAEAPTVDAVEVVHGRWNEKQELIPGCEDDVDTYCMCSICGAIEIGKTNYCHNCGAKMDGDGNG